MKTNFFTVRKTVNGFIVTVQDTSEAKDEAGWAPIEEKELVFDKPAKLKKALVALVEDMSQEPLPF